MCMMFIKGLAAVDVVICGHLSASLGPDTSKQHWHIEAVNWVPSRVAEQVGCMLQTSGEKWGVFSVYLSIIGARTDPLLVTTILPLYPTSQRQRLSIVQTGLKSRITANSKTSC
jgi:hypothetical protein